MNISATLPPTIKHIYNGTQPNKPTVIRFGTTREEAEEAISKVSSDCGSSCKKFCLTVLNCATHLKRKLLAADKAPEHLRPGKYRVLKNKADKASSSE
jgi:hypothetical protein